MTEETEEKYVEFRDWANDEDPDEFDALSCHGCGHPVGSFMGRDRNNPDVDAYCFRAYYRTIDGFYCEDCYDAED